MKTKWLHEILLATLSFLPLLTVMALGSRIPDLVPVHWNLHGQVDNWGSKYLLPLVSLPVYFVLMAVHRLAARNGYPTAAPKTLYIVRYCMAALFVVIHALVLSEVFYVNLPFLRIMTLLLCLFFLVLGNYIGTIRQNAWMGIRTPWTLKNEQIWRKTHSFTSRWWVALSVAVLVLQAFLPTNVLGYVQLAMIALLVLPSTVLSFYWSRQFPAQQDRNPSSR